MPRAADLWALAGTLPTIAVGPPFPRSRVAGPCRSWHLWSRIERPDAVVACDCGEIVWDFGRNARAADGD